MRAKAAIRAKSSDATSIQRLLIMIGGRLRRLDGLRAGAQAESVRETLGLLGIYNARDMPGQCGRRAFGLFGSDGIWKATSMTDLKPVENSRFEERLAKSSDSQHGLRRQRSRSVAKHALQTLQRKGSESTQDN